MKKYIKILNPIYPFKFHIFIGYDSLDEVKKILHLKKREDTKSVHQLIDNLDYANAHAYTEHYKGNILILIKKFEKKPLCFDTLHHEIIHAINFAAEYIGIEYNKGSEEFYAYLTGFLTKEIYGKIL